ncbi:MAG: cation diffusion facilitator family transporter [Bacteroidales bacterium]|nr:cation diffusion facilitator family transporter [Bacteroidales bacterium]
MQQKNLTYKASKAALISIISNTTLIVLKIIASVLTGSFSILSEAFHSISDLLASIITWMSLRYSEVPADEKHPYGHKKIENITASIEAILVLLAALYIFYESIYRIIDPVEIQLPFIAIGVMTFSVVVNFFVSKYLYNIVSKTNSLALEGDALHLRADMFASAGMVVGFIVIAKFHWHIIDPLLAILVAIYMTVEGMSLFKKAFNPLLDEAADKNEIGIIRKYLETNHYEIHNLKTRKAGNTIFAEFHLELPPEYSLQQVHDICDTIETDLKKQIQHLELIIHVEPFDKKE